MKSIYLTMKRFILLIVVLGMHGEVSYCDEMKKIQWYTSEFPPAFIKEGKLKGTGFGTETLSILQAGLPEYTHQRRWASVARIYADMKEGKNLCSHVNVSTPERNKVAIFSNNITTPSLRIIMSQPVYQQYFFNQNSLSLESLLNDTRFRMGIAHERSYGLIVSPIIAKYQTQKNVFIRAGTDLSVGLVKMLDLNRIDYVTEFSWVLNYIKRNSNLENSFQVLKIQEIQDLKDQYMVGGVACTRNAWGKHVIEKIDQASLRDTIQMRTKVEEWLNPEEIPSFRKAWNILIIEPLRKKINQ
ncbi:MAG: TIGR02285 family protein [SAR324 cluster bacterium]|nr:TIGR02285 family protein [SAR324 cluster bacterium]